MSSTTVQKYEQSLERAEQHREVWDAYEDELLFDGDIALVAEVLGRTTYAVAQRRVQVRRGATPGDKGQKIGEVTYRGWTEDQGDGW